jgi:predicted aminopeptidase
MTTRRALVLAAVAAAALLAGGCSTLGYYYQAARGQLALVSAAKPVAQVIDDPATPEDLRARLETARAIRAFASRELQLPDNAAYRKYTDLQRPFVVWNVFAAPEFSVRPRQWCFPVAGCVAYKGWFEEAKAEALAGELREQGYDVLVLGVPAYSTLGWFDDPLLSTFIGYPRAEVARLLFHELAHQVAYASDDTTFNESFATAVEREGVRRWLAVAGSETERAEFESMDARKRDFVALVTRTRERLEALYAQPLAPDAMRTAKAAAFDRMRSEYEDLKRAWGGFRGYDRWFAQPLGNAHLASVASYTEMVPGFEGMLAAHRGDLPAFYAEAVRLAKLPAAERQRALHGYATGARGSAIAGGGT